MDTNQRKVGRPKAPPRTGPLVLGEDYARAKVTFEISERVFEVRVAEDVYKKLQAQAASLHQPVPKVVDEILRRELT